MLWSSRERSVLAQEVHCMTSISVFGAHCEFRAQDMGWGVL
jgi:hypothetical protein